MSRLLGLILTFIIWHMLFSISVYATDYYIAPDANLDGTPPTIIGSDDYTGTSPTVNGIDPVTGKTTGPWKTFATAVKGSSDNALSAGDTLILMDGIYYQSMFPNKIWGEANNPITIKAQNDGKAIIDAEFKGEAISLARYAFNALPAHLVFEGLTVRNGYKRGISINADYLTFKRIHTYQQYLDPEVYIIPEAAHAAFHPFIAQGEHILIEDCISSGGSEKTLKVIGSNYVTVRRCLVHWHFGENYLNFNPWPWSGSLNIYHTGNNIVENTITTGNTPSYGINMHGDGTELTRSIGNKYLGNMIVNIGYTQYGDLYQYSSIRPQPSYNARRPDGVIDFDRKGIYVGFAGSGKFKDFLWQDMFIYGNAGVGFSRNYAGGAGSENNQIVRATIMQNGRHAGGWLRGTNPQIDLGGDPNFTITDSLIEGDPTHTGPGADITTRYVDGVKTSEPLWPWPMEQRVRDELGYSVTNMLADVAPDQVERISHFFAPIVATDKTVVNYPQTRIGETKTETVIVSNKGDASLVLDSFKLISEHATHPDALRIVPSTTCTQTITLAPNETCTIDIDLSPVTLDFYSGRLLITPANMGSAKLAHVVHIVGWGQPTNPRFDIPGTIEAEYYSAGHDDSIGYKRWNQPGFTDEVDVRISRDALEDYAGLEVWDFKKDEWVEYPISVTESKDYSFGLRYVTKNADCRLAVELDGARVAEVDLPVTGGWEDYADIELPPIDITSGDHTLRLVNIGQKAFGLNRLTSPPVISNTPMPTPTISPVPTPPSTDIDNDSDTDWLDLSILITNFSQIFDSADFNLSGFVDIFDFNTLISNL